MSFGGAILRSRTSSDAKAVRLALTVFVVWVFAGIKSCEEISYSMSGQTAQAAVVKVSPQPDQWGVDLDHRYTLTYQWADADTQKLRKATVQARPRDFGGELPKQIDIIYLSGDTGASTPLSRRSWLWPALFVGSTALAIGSFVLLGRSLTR